jgi:caffeoyl-CoA O-methyltransferase
MPGGEVITCDIDPENTKIAKAHWDKSPVGNLISLKIGPALETIKSLSGPFDLVFIDADKENYLNYWEACLPKVRQGGLIVVDNVLWSGRVLNPEDETDRSICAFNKVASTDPRVEGVMLTVRDGLWVCTKN